MSEIIKQRFYRISQSRLRYLIYQLQNQLLINTILFNKSYNLIDRLSIWICSSTIARVINIYSSFLSVRQFHSTIARAFYSLQFEKNFEIYAFANQTNVFFSISFEIIHRFVRQQLIFFRICTSIFITIWNIWSKHTRLQVKSTRFLCSRSRMHVMNLYRKFSFKTIFNSLVMKHSIVMNLFTKSQSKIESFFAFVSFVKSLSTYEEKLASFQYWIWKNNDSTKEFMIVVEFKCIDDEYRAKCMHCSLKIANNRNFESLKKHFQKSSECSFVLQLEITKSIFVVADIDFFDATFVCDIQKFNLFSEIANFLQQFRQCQHQYRKSDLLILLLDCLRDFALFWYQKQSEIVKQNLNEWLEVLIIAFSTKSSKFETFSVSSARFSSQYHSCLNCFACFSSLTRLLQHTQKIVCKKIVCKHCEKIFDSKNKLHEHFRQHHAKKIVKNVSRRNCNRERNKISSTISSTIQSIISSTTTSKFSIFRFVTISEQTRNSFISFAISAATSKQIFWISSKRSRFALFTFEITSKSVKIASTTCSLFIFFATFASRFRKSISKFHFTIDDLIRMFREKLNSFDLSQHQKRRFSSQNSDARRFTHQSRIIVYFLSAVNQKTSISQNLKNSNSKSFQQFTFAKSISFCRFVFVSILSKKSIFSSYKKLNIFYISLQSKFSTKFSFLQSKFSFAWFSFTFSSFFRFSSSNHACCICFDHFSFSNDSFNYSRLNQRYFWNRRSMREIWKRWSFRDEICRKKEIVLRACFENIVCRKTKRSTWLEFDFRKFYTYFSIFICTYFLSSFRIFV